VRKQVTQDSFFNLAAVPRGDLEKPQLRKAEVALPSKRRKPGLVCVAFRRDGNRATRDDDYPLLVREWLLIYTFRGGKTRRESRRPQRRGLRYPLAGTGWYNGQGEVGIVTGRAAAQGAPGILRVCRSDFPVMGAGLTDQVWTIEEMLGKVGQ